MSQIIELIIPSFGRWNLSKFLDNRKVESISITGFVLFQNAKVGAKELLPAQFGSIKTPNDFHSLKSNKFAMIQRALSKYVKLENDNGVFEINARKIIIQPNPDVAYDPTQEFEISCDFSNSDYGFRFVASIESEIEFVKAVIVKFALSEEQVKTIDLQSKNTFIVPLSHLVNINKSMLTISDTNIKLVPYVKKFIFRRPAKKNNYIWVSRKMVRLAIDNEIGQPQNVVLDIPPYPILSDYQINSFIQNGESFKIYDKPYHNAVHDGFLSLSCVEYDDRYELVGYPNKNNSNFIAIIIEFKQIENTDQSIVNKMQCTNRAVSDYLVDSVSNLDFSSDNTQSVRNNKSNGIIKEENEMSKELFGKVYGPVPDGSVAMDITGQLVIKPFNSESYKRFDVKTGKMVDMLDHVFKLNKNLAYILPVSIDTIVAGDIVVISQISNKNFYVVKSIDNEGVVKGINLSDSTMLDIIPESLVGSDISFVSKVINLLNPGTLDPMLMMMVLGDDDDTTIDTKTAMVMMMAMNNNGKNMNNMLPLVLMDKSDGSIKDLLLPMIMMNQDNGMNMNAMMPLMLLGDNEDNGNFKDIILFMMMNNNQTNDKLNVEGGMDSNMLLPLMLMDKNSNKKDILLMMTMLQKK